MESNSINPEPTEKLEITASRQFTPWLLEQNMSLVFTTYQAGKVFLIGLQPNGKLSVFERTFERCMGLFTVQNSLNKLWLLNSGTGEFGYVDLKQGKFEPVVFCPGYLRGCVLHGDFAIVGISQPRHNKTFQGLPLDEKLAQKKAQPRCGLLVIDLKKGDIVHSLRIEGVVEELYDVAVLPAIRRPMLIGFKTDEIRRTLTIGNGI